MTGNDYSQEQATRLPQAGGSNHVQRRRVPATLAGEYHRARVIADKLRVAAIARLDGNRALANLALYDAYYQIRCADEAQDVCREAVAQGNAYMALRTRTWRVSATAC